MVGPEAEVESALPDEVGSEEGPGDEYGSGSVSAVVVAAAAGPER